MLKTESIQKLCISLVALLTLLDLYLNYVNYPAVKNVTNIVIITLSVLSLLILFLAKNKGRYLFLIIAYIIVLGIYLPFLYPNNYATFNHLFTFWHLGVCLVLMVILGLFYSVKHIIGMACVNIVLMFIAFWVLQNTDTNYSGFNPVSILLFYLFAVVLYLLCNNLKQQHISNNIQQLEFNNKIELIQNEKKTLYDKVIVIDSYIKNLNNTHKSIENYIDTQFDGVDRIKANELKKIIRQNESEVVQLSSEIKETMILSLINILKVNYPTISKREAEVSVYTYYDYPNKLITKLTSLHEDSVSRYRMNIKKKMGVDNVNEMKKKLTLLFNENIDFKTPENTDPKPKTNK